MKHEGRAKLGQQMPEVARQGTSQGQYGEANCNARNVVKTGLIKNATAHEA
jgi:hypothetical protein